MSRTVDFPRRVVITGLGVICPLGITPDAVWQALAARRSGVAAIPESAGRLPISFAARAEKFTGDIDDFGPLDAGLKKAVRKALKLMCRESQMGVAAAERALADSGLAADARDPERSGVVFGADYMLTEPAEFSAAVADCATDGGRFEYARWGQQGLAQMSPLWLLKYLPNMPASHLAIYNDFRGPNNSITHREASSNLAAGEAFRIIARGHADVMLTGATGTRIHPMKSVHAAQLEQLATNGHSPESASRPFDLNRTGMVLGEGAAALVLEELSRAEARGARIYGEIVATASATSLDRRRIAHRDDACERAMRAALAEAGIAPAELGHIHAHGLSTTSGDEEEARAIGRVFGDAADRPPVTAAKSYFGNLGAAGGMVELITSLLAQTYDRLFPILNYETPDPACPISAAASDDVPPGDSFLNLSVTPQGQASCLIVRRYA